MDDFNGILTILKTLGYSANGDIVKFSVDETNGYCNVAFTLKKSIRGIPEPTDIKLSKYVTHFDNHSTIDSGLVSVDISPTEWPKEYLDNLDKEKKEAAVANSWIKPVDISKDDSVQVLSKTITGDGVSATIERKPWVEKFLENADEKTKKYVVTGEKNEEKSEDSTDAPTNWKTPKPRSIIRYVFFKSHEEAEKFAKEYEKDFEQNLIMHITNDLSSYKIKKNVVDNDLYSKGYKWVLSFRMNGKSFGVLEEMENLKKRDRTGSGQGGGACVRYKE